MDGHGEGLVRAPLWSDRVRLQPHGSRRGIEMTPLSVLAEGPRRHFMTRRFDRGPAGERHHVISLCALAHLDFNMTGPTAMTIPAKRQSAQAGRRGPAAAYRRMVFNVMAVNHEDHTKNFAFLRRQGGRVGIGTGLRRHPRLQLEQFLGSSHLMAVMGVRRYWRWQISMLWAKGTTSRGKESGPRGA